MSVASHRKQQSEHAGEPTTDVVTTPAWLAEIMVRWAQETTGFRRAIRVLEPCFGNLSLVHAAMRQHWMHLEGYEIRSRGLDQAFCAVRPDLNTILHWETDFLLEPAPAPEERFDVALVNPPFSDLGAAKFAARILDQWLKPDGALISILPWYILDNCEGRKPWLDHGLRRIGLLPRNTFAPQCPAINAALVEMRPTPRTGPIQFEFISKPASALQLELNREAP